jgi:hypothetical protein
MMSSVVDRNAGTYTFLAKVPDGSLDAYDKTMKDLDIVTNPPKGLMLHSAGELNGINVIDLWRSKSEWENFRDNRLMAIGRKYGIVPTPNNFTDMTVTNAIILPTASQAKIAFSIRFQDATPIQYLEVMDRLNLGEGLPRGGCAHIASKVNVKDTSMHVFDLWADEKSAKDFYEKTLPPLLQHVGYKGQPTIETWSLHYRYVAQTATVSQ